MSHPDLELVYFNFAGRAKPIRIILALGGIPFKDTRLSFPEFGALTQTGELPLGTVPILKVDGRVAASQSGAITRYVATLAGLQLSGPTNVVRGEDAFGTLEDLAQLWSKWFSAEGEQKASNAVEFLESGFPFYARRLEALLQEGKHDGPYINESLSWPDVFAHCVLGYVDEVATSIDRPSPVSGFPKLNALHAAVAALPAVASYE